MERENPYNTFLILSRTWYGEKEKNIDAFNDLMLSYIL